MSSPEPPAPDQREVAAQRRIHRVLVVNIGIVVCVVTGVLGVWAFAVASRWILVIVALTVVYGSTLVLALRRNQRGELDRAVLVMNLAVWPLAVGATVIAAILGTMLGLAAGYFKGLADEIIMRTADVLSSIPTIVLALLITSTVDSKSMVIVMVVIAVVFTPIIARTVRSVVLGESELDYVAAARLRTEGTPHILVSEILPNVLPALAVEFTVRLGYAIFAMATLSFLGAGAGPESPDWGTQVATHYKYLNGLNWSATVFPAAAIASLALAVNLVQDALSEVFER